MHATLALVILAASAAAFGEEQTTYAGWWKSLTRVSVTVGRDTTYAMGPLRKDGTVDFAAALNGLFDDVKPDENAVVLLVQAFGPEVIPEGARAEYFRLLKCAPPPEKGAYLFHPYLKWTDDESQKALQKCVNGPWSAKEHPQFAEALRTLEPKLELAVAASKRRRYYEPWVTPKPGQSLLMCERTIANECRGLASLLRLRAMLRLYDGRLETAFDDLQAIRRIGVLMNGGPKSIVEGLAGNAITGVGLVCERAIPLGGFGDAARYRRRIAEILATRPRRQCHDAVRIERLEALDCATRALEYGFDQGVLSKGEHAGPAQKLFMAYLTDADEALRSFNGFYDDLEAADAITGERARSERLKALDKECWTRVRRMRNHLFEVWGEQVWEAGLRRGNGRFVGEGLRALFTPALIPAFDDATGVYAMNERQTVLAYALAAVKRERGSYPERLDAKELGLPAEVLIDPFTEKPFVYRVEKGKRQVVCAFLDRIVGPRPRRHEPNPTAGAKDGEGECDDFILELP